MAKFSYKCDKCKHEGYTFGLCPKCKDGLMIKKAGFDRPDSKRWQPYKRGDKCHWRNRRHN